MDSCELFEALHVFFGLLHDESYDAASNSLLAQATAGLSEELNNFDVFLDEMILDYIEPLLRRKVEYSKRLCAISGLVIT